MALFRLFNSDEPNVTKKSPTNYKILLRMQMSLKYISVSKTTDLRLTMLMFARLKEHVACFLKRFKLIYSANGKSQIIVDNYTKFFHWMAYVGQLRKWKAVENNRATCLEKFNTTSSRDVQITARKIIFFHKTRGKHSLLFQCHRTCDC